MSWNGLLSGTPTQPGSFDFNVRLVDTAGCRGEWAYRLDIGVAPRDAFLVGPGWGPANRNRVRVFDADGVPAATDFDAYAAAQWGINVRPGELDGAGEEEILTGPGPGPVFGPQVRGFGADGAPIPAVNYYAYGTLQYGVDVAAGSVDPTPREEMLSGAGPGAVFGPHVRGFGWSPPLAAIAKLNFFAYGTLKYGVAPAAGDVDGDGFSEILTGPGPGVVFGPQVRGFDFDGQSLGAVGKINFVALALSGFGAHLDSGEVDADGYDEIIVAPGPGPSHPARFKGFDYDDRSVVSAPGFDVTPLPSMYGGQAGAAQVDTQSGDELLVGAGPDPAADSQVISYAYRNGGLSLLPNGFAPFLSMYGVDVSGGGLLP